jgi:hypothetical protein
LSLASSIGPTFVFFMLNFELFIEVTYLKDSHSNSTQNENLYSFNCISCHLKPPLSIHQTQDTNIRFTKKIACRHTKFKNLLDKDGDRKHIFVCTHIFSYKLGYPNLKQNEIQWE